MNGNALNAGPQSGLRPGTLLVMSIACGVMVANIYLCQPLLAGLATAFGVPQQQASLVSVACQVGYACGILFIVPLADIVQSRRLVLALMTLSVAGLLAAAASAGIMMLLAASLVLAAASVVPQVLIPISTTLVQPDRRARAVSTLVTGLVLGILLSRALSGVVAQMWTWQAAYLAQATSVVMTTVLLSAFVPSREPAARSGYLALLVSLPPLFRHAELRLSMTLGFCGFAAFSAMWATLTFHLEGAPFHMGSAAAGLFGLWGAPGALLAPMVGRLSDRWGSAKVNLVGLASIGLSFVLAFTFGRASVVGLVLAVNLLDFGVQSSQVANQARIFGLPEQIRARLNTLYMVINFAGGALGALAGGIAWAHAGWTGVCALAFCLTAIAVGALAVSAWRPLGSCQSAKDVRC